MIVAKGSELQLNLQVDEQQLNMDKVTDSAEVTKRLGTDERGYERDEEESFGTDGGILSGGGSFGGGPGGMEPKLMILPSILAMF